MIRSLAICLALLSLQAGAQVVGSHDIEQLHVPMDGQGLLGVEGGTGLDPGDLHLQLVLDYESNPLVLRQNGSQVGSVVGDRLTTEVAASLAIIKYLELQLAIPLIPVQSGSSVSGLSQAPSGFTMSAIRAGAKVPFLFEKDELIDAALVLTLALPTQTASNSFAADPGVEFTPKLAVSRTLGPVRLHADLGVLLHNSIEITPGTSLGTELLYGGGVEVPIPGVLIIEGEVYGQEAFESAISSQGLQSSSLSVPSTNGFEGLVGLRKPLFGYASVFLAGAAGLSQAPGTPAFRILGGFSLDYQLWGGAEPVKEVPPCDPSRLTTGPRPRPDQCPDLDNDADGILNRDDLCPEEPGPAANQGCPVDPAIAQNAVLPPPSAKDSDGDGIPDEQDYCPAKPEDKDAFEDGDGCPEPDNDLDGVPDKDDRCLNVAGPASNFGCPPIDTDKDGVPDAIDNCPTVPGPASNQGCPLKEKQRVVITLEGLGIKDKVYFATNKAKILPKSFALLDNVVKVLNKHPELAAIEVQGHTDNVGAREHNLELSTARANSVRSYLLAKGLPPGRVTAVGYGPDHPSADNKTAKGREKNRRVEFVIADPGAK